MHNFHDDGDLVVLDVPASTECVMDLEVTRIEDVVARVPYGALKMNLVAVRSV